MKRYRYRKKKQQAERTDPMVIGRLHLVSVRLKRANSGELLKHKMLMVGYEGGDIERKLRWVFDAALYSEFAITEIREVKESVHILSTVVTEEASSPQAVIDRGERTENVHYPAVHRPARDAPVYRQFAVGITTRISAGDQASALRRVGKALENRANGKTDAGPTLSEDAVIHVEEISGRSGFASPRDVSNEINRAHMVRG